MQRTIAVLTDLSQASREAFGAAVAIARKFASRLLFLHTEPVEHIVTPWQVPPSTAERFRQFGEAQKKLDDFLRNSRDLSGVEVEACTVPGGTPESVCEMAGKHGAEILVMATHGRSGMERFLMGSFTARVLQSSQVPVLVIQHWGPRLNSPRRPFSPELILVPTDLSPGSRHVCQAARSWAQAFGARVRLVHVVESELRGGSPTEVDSTIIDDPLESHRSRARAELDELIQKELADVPSEAAVRVGLPTVEIPIEAEETKADLVVMTSRALCVIDRCELRSVAERAIQTGPCPVLIVK